MWALPGEFEDALPGITLILTLLTAGAISLPLVFPHTTQAFIARWVEAGANESQAYGEGGVFARLAYEALLFSRVAADTPPAGYGLGSCGNAAWEMGVREQVIFFRDQDERNAAENSDWGRNILELGPIFGFLFILFRVAFVATLIRDGLASTRRSGHSFPLMLALYVSVLLFFWQITGNGTLKIRLRVVVRGVRHGGDVEGAAVCAWDSSTGFDLVRLLRGASLQPQLTIYLAKTTSVLGLACYRSPPGLSTEIVHDKPRILHKRNHLEEQRGAGIAGHQRCFQNDDFGAGEGLASAAENLQLVTLYVELQ